MDVFICTLLYLIGGALPLAGLIRVAIRTRGALPKVTMTSMMSLIEEGSKTGMYSIEPMKQAAKLIDESPLLAWRQIRWDLVLVGGGIVCATAASIWSLHLGK